jgi:hypothetical protein
VNTPPQRLPPELPRGRYRHYKGNDYEIIATAGHSETGELLVLYRALYGDYSLWVRPITMFYEAVTLEQGVTPRFTYMGPERLEKLGPRAWNAARAFLTAQARPLERALFHWRFEGGDPQSVVVALAPYQNPDGGFGHGLEPDLMLAGSSVLATTRALQTLRDLHADAGHPMVIQALAFLRTMWDAAADRWPFIPPNTDDAPHAPWWAHSPDHDEQFGGYLINPRLEILGYLWDWGAAQDRPWLEQLTERALDHLESLARALSKDEVACCLRFAESTGVPHGLRLRAAEAAARLLPLSVTLDPARWGEYTMQPLHAAPTPASPLAPALAASLPANLDHRLAAQQPDGAWHPNWSWFGLYDADWPASEQAWKGILTLETLEILTAWGRVAL